ncbi:CPBP family intramembrane metalloprotease [Clostridium estertheticum]|uniref:CPBP family intramembrane glutamic endopeptidase n=1 Tax=Clostridium estertheticum TaxID=238834 RepID=UPI001CF49625|nr:type II CAAX endopeptidase family protein [Clostridium estertheticum]MCB2305846.1 CPBP family intramembrane metalloprotease [Clostridium estertheticum]MCB2344185.1 CPBP family intramembrane metalloprotease [Clostridium estertheticum]MCB2348201.1 CPBP family intramembrane metalloprotease [Clostridium estertheticum]WAG45836.1 CPBP family intramembrane metalloprotease [Clostridium estertheticum]
MKNKKILLANSLLLLALLLFILVPFGAIKIFKLVRPISENVSLLLSGSASVIVLGGIALLYCIITKKKFKNVMVIKKISIKQVYLTIFVAFGTYIFAMGINAITIKLFPFAIKDGTQISNLLGGSTMLLGLLVVVLVPAFFEEIFFRGIFLDAYDGVNKKIKYFIITSIFAAFHGNVMQIMYVMFLGFILLMVREYTGSIVGSMTLHAANNAISFILSKVLMNYMKSGIESSALKSSQEANATIASVLIQATVAFLIGGAIIYTNLRKLKEYKDTESRAKRVEQEENNEYLKYVVKDEKNLNLTKYIPLAIYFVSMVVIVVNKY